MLFKLNKKNIKGRIFFASDEHFYHKNVINHDQRPFLNEQGEPDVELMNAELIFRWNSVVTNHDIVFYLGDLAFCNQSKMKEVADSLNGEIHFIMGNHDNIKHIENTNRFKTVNYYAELWLRDGDEHHHFIMSHYPIYSWNRKHHNSIMVHGHCHHSIDELEFHKENRIIDVGVNGHNYFPISFEEVIELINTKDLKYV
jgi:calcineurin-like phosphoesterase family protein